MQSRFTVFFILTRSLLQIVPISFLLLPFFILFNNDPKFKNEPKVLPAVVVAAIVIPLAIVVLKNSSIVKLKFDTKGIYMTNLVRNKTLKYRYSDIDRIEFRINRTQGYTNRFGVSRDIHDSPIANIYFSDGFEFTLTTDTYSNCQEMIDYIESRKPIIKIL